MDASVWMDAWRGIVTAIDRAILNLIVALYDIMNSLATQQIFSEKTITEFATRIYTLLALIMIFKVTFSLITYLVNPDTIADKEAGAGNMAKNVVVMLILIIMVPYGFDFLYRAQGALIEDNFVANLIYGTNSNEVGVSSMYMSPVCKGIGSADIKDTGEFLAIATIRPFYQIDEKLTESGSDGTVSYNGAGEGVYDTISEYCTAYTINKLMSSKIYAKTTKRGILGFDRGFYVINYSTLLSTICCIVVLILMLTTCLDIALRVVKLGFLELIAPIPIISYIDPKSGKNGIFKKWVDAVIGTWATLFIKLAVVYFAIYTVSLVGEAFKNVQDDNNIWVMLFMVIGALMFAKQAPKLIEDIFGIKLDGMAFHPIKKIQEQAVGGKAITTGTGMVAGAAVGAVGGAAANVWAARINNRNALKEIGAEGKKWSELTDEQKIAYKKNAGLTRFGTFRSALAGAGSAAVRSASAGKDGKFQPLKNASKGITGSGVARSRRDAGYGLKTSIIDAATDMAHIPQSYGTTSIQKNEKKMKEQKLNDLMARTEALRDQASYYKGQNPSSSLAYNEAGKFKWVDDENGKQHREFVYKSYDDYNDLMLKQIENATGDELERLNAIGILSRAEFEKIRAFDSQIMANEEERDKLKKEISKIDENMKKDNKG